jgi:hypothetical protein
VSRIAGIGVIAALVVSSARADAQSTEGFVIADEVRTAFYEHAPDSLATPMLRTVIRERGRAAAELRRRRSTGRR